MKNKSTNHKKFLKNSILIYGKHSALAALSNKNRCIKKIYLTENNNSIEESILRIISLTKGKANIERVNNKLIEKLIGKKVKHQGVLLIANKLRQNSAEEIFKKVDYKVGVVLDKVTDPNNVGAIYRSANCFKIDFILNLEKGAVKESSTLLSSACGAFEAIDSYYSTNLISILKKFKSQGWWILGGSCSMLRRMSASERI